MRRSFTTVALILVATFAVLFACRKEVVEDPQFSTILTVSEAKQWFDQNIVSKNPTRTEGDIRSRKQLRKDPDWRRGINKIMRVGNAVVVPLVWESDWTPKLSALGAERITPENEPSLSLNSLTYLVMYRDRRGKMQSEVLTAMPEKEWVVGNRNQPFTGAISIEDWNGKFIRGYKYHKGEITAQFTTEKPESKEARVNYMQDVECGYTDLLVYVMGGTAAANTTTGKLIIAGRMMGVVVVAGLLRGVITVMCLLEVAEMGVAHTIAQLFKVVPHLLLIENLIVSMRNFSTRIAFL